ncbi:MAG: helix-turn-helix transcriptional regulator [Phenylobacterium sp.]|uniref:helix-turn-helix transcriptional regulator n=1 Tax=Phenylobacterium sp. TaxID=1871053 RepID=UPI003BB59D5D
MSQTRILLNIAGDRLPGAEVRRERGDPSNPASVMILNGHGHDWRARSSGGAFSLKWAPRGAIRYRVEDADHLVRPGGMMLVNAGQPYEMDFQGAGQSFCLFFSDALVREALGGERLAEFPNLIFRPAFAGQVAALYEGLDGDNPWPDDLEATLLSILDQAVEDTRRHRGEAARLPAAKASTRRHLLARLEVARALIADGEGENLDQIARASGLSKFHLVRLFRAAFGTTPMKYAEGLRLDRAAERLRGSGTLIEEIGFSAGYESLGAFGRAFRRRFGAAPGAYRQASRN